MDKRFKEIEFENIIENHLLNNAEYQKSVSANYNKEFCIDAVKLFEFLENTQPKQFAEMQKGSNWQNKFLKRIYDQINKKGIIEIMRKGIKHGLEFDFTLYYKNPSSGRNREAVANYKKNIFSITRQLQYSTKNKNSLDIVLFINGLPLISVELKNKFTRQNYLDAERQYKNDRNPKEPLFRFARCLVHFAADQDLVSMTTQLKGKNTFFLPFNKGYNSGAGNPPNKLGLRTEYLWKDFFSKEKLSTIIEKYAQIVEEKDEDTKKIKRKLIFPRYHQFDAVSKLLTDAKINGTGQRYLIQHSAGSGKSNSITWLAHQLVELHDSNENAIFDSIIVVTDRRILDKQIRDNIKQFAQVKGVVQAITQGSRQLKTALEEGKKIIITTIQKFPYVVDEIGLLKSNKFAIIIDEAHSSQTGETAGKMNRTLSAKNEEAEEETTEDKILQIMQSRRMLPNASYFAFTATPKPKTEELFGTAQENGKFRPFHNYTMKQAIEEEFILDVLKNYTTFQSYYKLLKTIENDPVYDTRQAKKKLKKYVENNEFTINKKAEIMIDHFVSNVRRKINYQAKTMVVTGSILQALKYYFAFTKILKNNNLPYKAIVAFSGKKEYEGIEYEEDKLNGFSSNDIAKEFKKQEYKFLIVANKFQTGFDQPLLQTMYVDKKLEGVQAVQTLSRLNRAYKPHKTETFVLDFYNTVDNVRDAFQPYYKITVLSEETDRNRLNDLQDALDNSHIYTLRDIDEYIELLLNDTDREILEAKLDLIVENYEQELDEDNQIEFKQNSVSYCRTYTFLSQISNFSNPYYEKLNLFINSLHRKLPRHVQDDETEGLNQAIDLGSYRNQKTIDKTDIILSTEEEEIDPLNPTLGGGGIDRDFDMLSEILEDFNNRFGTQFTEDDNIRKFIFEELPASVKKDEKIMERINITLENKDISNAKITSDKKVNDLMQDQLFIQTALYKEFTNNTEFRNYINSFVFNNVSNNQSFAPK